MKTRGRPLCSTQGNDQRRRAIAKASAHSFAKLGYDKTTIRGVAEKAGVDPKLVMHYFGNKERLFLSTIPMPINPVVTARLLRLVPRSMWGAKLAEVFFSGGEHGGPRQTGQGVIRAAASEPVAAKLFRSYYGEFFIPIFRSLGIDHPEFRAVTVSSLFAGFTFTSRIVDLESLGGSDRASRIAMLATLVQTALTVEVTTPVVASAAGSAMPPTIAAHRR